MSSEDSQKTLFNFNLFVNLTHIIGDFFIATQQ